MVGSCLTLSVMILTTPVNYGLLILTKMVAEIVWSSLLMMQLLHLLKLVSKLVNVTSVNWWKTDTDHRHTYQKNVAKKLLEIADQLWNNSQSGIITHQL